MESVRPTETPDEVFLPKIPYEGIFGLISKSSEIPFSKVKKKHPTLTVYCSHVSQNGPMVLPGWIPLGWAYKIYLRHFFILCHFLGRFCVSKRALFDPRKLL